MTEQSRAGERRRKPLKHHAFNWTVIAAIGFGVAEAYLANQSKVGLVDAGLSQNQQTIELSKRVDAQQELIQLLLDKAMAKTIPQPVQPKVDTLIKEIKQQSRAIQNRSAQTDNLYKKIK